MNHQSFYAKRLNILLALNQIRSQLLIISKLTGEINDPDLTAIIVKAKFDKVYKYTETISEDIREIHPVKCHKPERLV